MGVDGGVVAIGIPRQRLDQIIVCVIDVFLPHDGNERVRFMALPLIVMSSKSPLMALSDSISAGDQIVGAAYRLGWLARRH
ncbi:hypothetical protein IVU49_18390 [Salmonella enterica subsp. enterica serovar Worthington]|nr:hypothetical protein [Salmonella enterica subsp. enterica serovar Worthington]